jgi:septal ring factor EnvC (AmiA/AmiB activator)
MRPAAARATLARAAAAAGALLALGPAALAQDRAPTREELRRVETEKAEREDRIQNLLRNAEGARQEVRRLQGQLLEATRQLQALERDAERQETRLVDLRRREQAARANLVTDREALEDVLAALVRMERQKPPPLAVRPADAVEAVRAASLLGAITPPLQARAQRVAAELDRVRALRAQLLDQNVAFRQAEAALLAQARTIETLARDRAELERRLRADAADEQARVRQLADRAATLRELIERLVRPDRAGPRLPAPPGLPGRFAQAQGAIAQPTAGAIVRRFNAGGPDDARTRGVTFQARRGGAVVAPFDGRIEFAGEFRSYGRVLILNVGGGYHIVLAGLDTVFGVVGQEVLAGEPIGVMSAGGQTAPELYMEVRREGRPVDPGPWLQPARARG